MRRDSGFSMVELMIAMTVTLIVSGAIYGLLTSGSTAFRREPEMADRQQNIRVAMDLVARDVFNAGSALPTFAQVFSADENVAAGPCGPSLNGCGPQGSLGPVAAAARAPGDGGDPSTNTDVIEIVSTEETCPVVSICNAGPPGGSSGVFATRTQVPQCAAAPGLVMLTDGQNFTIQASLPGAVTDQACQSPNEDIAQNGEAQLSAGLAPWTAIMPAPSSAPPPNLPVVFFYSGRVVRYKIAPNNDPIDPGPALWRSRSGRYGIQDGLAKLDPDESGFPSTNSPWELVARGIEDLQFEYLWGDGLWHNSPPISVANDWTTIVRQVRITISARASAVNLQGATSASGGAPDAIRGQLVTDVTPRAAFNELQMGLQIQ